MLPLGCAVGASEHGAPTKADTTIKGFLPRRSMACWRPRGTTLKDPGLTGVGWP